jgi:hypothetical protein
LNYNKKIIFITQIIIFLILILIKFKIFIIQIIISLGMAAQSDPRILGPAAQLDLRTVSLAGQPDPTPFCSVSGMVERDLTLLDHVGQQDPTLVVPFRNVLGLAWQSDPTAFGPAPNPNQIVFGRGNNALSPNC